MRSLLLAVFSLAFSAWIAVPTASAGDYAWRSSIQTQDTESTAPWSRVRFNPTSENTVWAARAHFFDITLAEPPSGDGLWGSDDNGDTWNRVNSGPLLDSYNVLDFAFCETNGDVAYAATNVGGIFKTDDGGVTWTDVNAGINTFGIRFPHPRFGVASVAVHPTDCDRVYIGIGNLAGQDLYNPSLNHPGFFYSTDGGATWTENNENLPPRRDGDPSDTVYESTGILSLSTASTDPDAVYLGTCQLEVNDALRNERTAVASAEVYRNGSGGAGAWESVGWGLPTIEETVLGIPHVGRVAVSGAFVQAVPHRNSTVLAVSHFGYGQKTTLLGIFGTIRHRGVFALPPGQSLWIARNRGLPVVTDLVHWNAVNVWSLAIRPGDVYTMVSGIANSESAGGGNSNVWATTTAGAPWFNGWASGLAEEGNGEYYIANTNSLAFNKQGNRVAATVNWGDGFFNATSPYDGVYLLP